MWVLVLDVACPTTVFPCTRDLGRKEPWNRTTPCDEMAGKTKLDFNGLPVYQPFSVLSLCEYYHAHRYRGDWPAVTFELPLPESSDYFQ